MSRWTRRSTVSSLFALSVLATGCGGTDTHSAQEVQRAFAAHGVVLREVPMTLTDRQHAFASARTMRIGNWLFQADYVARTTGQRTVKLTTLESDDSDVEVIVFQHPFVAHAFERQAPIPAQLRSVQRGNLWIIGGRQPAVAAALADLR